MYHFATRVEDDFDTAIDSTIAALKSEGFGVLTDIDIQATLKAKLDIDRRPYRILGACNPPLANQALESEPEVGLLLPCNVVVREDDNGAVLVEFMDPVAVLQLTDNPAIAAIADDVRGRLERVMAALGGSTA